MGAGAGDLDALKACTMRSVTVGNTPGVLTEATADMGWALLMAAARRIPEGNAFAKSDAYTAYVNAAADKKNNNKTSTSVAKATMLKQYPPCI